MCNEIYEDFLHNFRNASYLNNHAIVTPTNRTVTDINEYMLAMVPSVAKTYFSIDSLTGASTKSDQLDIVYPDEFLNSLSFNGLPEHRLELKCLYLSCYYEI
ncbi:unnamed protein product [Linum tenue]|uniref:ATP-dependent DNA helicase n=1 Tax=Linum tenue TaxID=586396 RepID=A0AAV0LIY5_9ROSI|nr:unnamed protein product [Linum tenue]